MGRFYVGKAVYLMDESQTKLGKQFIVIWMGKPYLGNLNLI